MPGVQFAARTVRRWLPTILWTSGLCAQTCLVLSPPTVTTDGTAEFDLSLYAPRGKAPAAIQWIFQYVASDISSLTVKDGPALHTSLKTAFCAGDTGAYNCVAAGLNRRAIVNGVIARVTAVPASGASTAAIQIANAVAASPSGYAIRVVTSQSPTGDGVFTDCRPLSLTIGSASK